MSLTAIDARMSTMLPAGAAERNGSGLPDFDESIVDVTDQRWRVAPSASVTGFPPVVTIGTFACLTRASVASMSRTTSTSVAVPGILDPQLDRLVIDVLDLHRLDAGPDARHSRRLVALLRARDIEHGKEPRIRVVVRPRAGLRQRRHLHAEHVVIERQRPVHVLHERRERAGVDDAGLARGRGGRGRLFRSHRACETHHGARDRCRTARIS